MTTYTLGYSSNTVNRDFSLTDRIRYIVDTPECNGTLDKGYLQTGFVDTTRTWSSTEVARIAILESSNKTLIAQKYISGGTDSEGEWLSCNFNPSSISKDTDYIIAVWGDESLKELSVHDDTVGTKYWQLVSKDYSASSNGDFSTMYPLEVGFPGTADRLLHLMITYVSSSAPTNWWNTNWAYRKLHHISGSVDGNLTDYCKKIIIHSGSGTDGDDDVYCKCQSDFSDIRFIISSTNDYINCYREQYITDDKSLFWIKCPWISSTTGFDLYVYYGNNSASVSSNGSNTFTWFEDFESGLGSLDTAGATNCTATQTDSQSQQGTYSISSTNASQGHSVRLQNDTQYSPDDYTFDCWLRTKSGWTDNDGLGPGMNICGTAGTNNGYQLIHDPRDADSPQIREGTDYSSRTDGDYQVSNDTWYFYTGYRSGSDLKVELWTSGQLYGSNPQTTTTRASETSISTGYHGIYCYGIGGYHYWDAYRIKLYTEDEPIHGLWSNEEEYGGVITWTSYKLPIGSPNNWVWNSGQYNNDDSMLATSDSPTTWEWGSVSSSTTKFFPSGSPTYWKWVSGSCGDN